MQAGTATAHLSTQFCLRLHFMPYQIACCYVRKPQGVRNSAGIRSLAHAWRPKKHPARDTPGLCNSLL